jgi:Arc/MetJ family transcription regulator
MFHSNLARTSIDLDEGLLREARQLIRLKTKPEIVNTAWAFFVRSRRGKGILRYPGTGICKGDWKAMRRNRVRSSSLAPCESILSVLSPDPLGRNCRE